MRSSLIFGLLVSLLVAASTNAAGIPRDYLQKEASLQQVRERLLPLKEWMPYPDYNNRKGWDAFTGELKIKIIQEGEKHLLYQWQVIKATDYLEYERTGNRVVMEKPYNENVMAINQLLLAELAEGKGRFMDQIINGVWAVCDMSSWSLSAHLPSQKYKRSLPDPSEQYIDLKVGDVGSLLAWSWYFFKDEWDKINPIIATRVQKNITERILMPYLQRSDYWWQAFDDNPKKLVNNWNPWCNSNVLICYLLLEKNPDSLAYAVHRTMQSVDEFINYVKEDGACEEGPSYWGHAAGKLYDYLQLLHDASGGKISIFDHSMIKQMGEYISRSYVGKGWVVNFADASAKGSSEPGVVFRFGKAVSSIEMQDFAAYLLQKENITDYIYSRADFFRALENIASYKLLKDKKPGLPKYAYTWYPQTEVVYMKNENYFFAAKGGFNNESHNHNDVGSFNLYVDSIPFIIDIGVGTYTRQTFSSERYQIWTMQSNYHNLPVINGAPQLFGREYKASQVRFDPKKMNFSIDLAKAYGPNAFVKKWARSYSLSSKGLNVSDDFSLSHLADSTSINFMTWAKPQFSSPGIITLEKEGKKLCIQYHKDLQPVVDEIMINDNRLNKIWGQRVYRLQFYVKTKKANNQYQMNFYKL